jgi:hypothetical protein
VNRPIYYLNQEGRLTEKERVLSLTEKAIRRDARIERRHQERLRRLQWRDRQALGLCPTCGQKRVTT